jgi:MFS family permease
MRRLLVLVSLLVLVDTMLYAALTPLLGKFAHELHLSSASAGVLVAAYAAGALVGGLPGGMAAAAIGPRRAVLAGLALMGIASIGFAWADTYPSLAAARFVQGAGSAFTWAGAFAWLIAAAPRERRGEMIGTAMGAAVMGAMLGPVLGAVAAVAGRGPVFSCLAVLAAVLAVLAAGTRSMPAERPRVAAVQAALRNGEFSSGLALLALGSLLFGVLDVLAPLHLYAAGWASAAIGAVWLFAAAIETVQAPFVGRLSDRRGALVPVRWALAAGAVGSLALVLGFAPLPYALLVVAVNSAYGILFTPAFALIADGAEHAGLAQGMAFGMMNAAWALGAMAGPAAGGALAVASGEEVPFALASLACAASLWAIKRWAPAAARRPAVPAHATAMPIAVPADPAHPEPVQHAGRGSG